MQQLQQRFEDIVEKLSDLSLFEDLTATPTGILETAKSAERDLQDLRGDLPNIITLLRPGKILLTEEYNAIVSWAADNRFVGLMEIARSLDFQLAPNGRIRSLTYKGDTIEDISALSALPDLETLNLDENQIRDLDPLRTFSSLRHLSLRKNKITDISPLSDLVELQSLSLQNNYLEDISALAKLTNLVRLNIGSCQISDYELLKHFPNLAQLNISSNPARDIRPVLALSKLTHLTIEVNAWHDSAPELSELLRRGVSFFGNDF